MNQTSHMAEQLNHTHHFKRATVVAIFAICIALFNGLIILILTEFGMSALVAGYAASGTNGFMFYMLYTYLNVLFPTPETKKA